MTLNNEIDNDKGTSNRGLFLGRGKELSILNAIASDAGIGGAESAVILGCNGVGKTALLRHIYHQLFYGQKEIVPFFYSISPIIRDVTLFSEDYILKFMQQSLAYLKKEPEILRWDTLLLDDIKAISGRMDRRWASEIIDEFLHVGRANNPAKIFLFAVTTPIKLYEYLKKPIIVLMDNFNEIYRIGDLWRLFEEPIRYPYTPHIFTGNQPMLNRMFFHETSIGRHLRLITLSGLEKEDAKRLFGLFLGNRRTDIEYDAIINKLNGNPFYIRVIARSLNRIDDITTDRVMEIYYNEVRDGVISTYWISHLKRYIPFHLRDTALRLLYHLYSINTGVALSDIEGLPFMKKEEIKDIIDSLLMAGVLTENFTRIRLLDDKVFADFINETYHKEYPNLHAPVDETPEEIINKEIGKETVGLGVMERWKVYIASLLMIIIIGIVAYIKLSKPVHEMPLPQKGDILFPTFRDDAIEMSLKIEGDIVFPTFREEVLKR